MESKLNFCLMTGISMLFALTVVIVSNSSSLLNKKVNSLDSERSFLGSKTYYYFFIVNSMRSNTKHEICPSLNRLILLFLSSLSNSRCWQVLDGLILKSKHCLLSEGLLERGKVKMELIKLVKGSQPFWCII